MPEQVQAAGSVVAARPATVYIGDVAEKIDYPNTKFEAIQIADHNKQGDVVLVARCTEADNFSEDPTATFTVCRADIVQAYYSTEDEALAVIRQLVHYLACHEADEKLVYDGRKLYNPHATLQPASRFV